MKLKQNSLMRLKSAAAAERSRQNSPAMAEIAPCGGHVIYL